MKLAEVSRGVVYIDTNVLYMYLRADPLHLAAIELFLKRVVRGEITACVSLFVVDELYYRLLLALVKEHTGRNPLDVLREDLPGTIVEHGDRITSALRKLLGLPNLTLVDVTAADLDRMLENITRFGLLPRDAAHVALMQRLGITGVASDDMDFDRVAGIERHWVINAPNGE